VATTTTGQTGLDSNAIQTIVDFRSKVRALAIENLKTVKSSTTDDNWKQLATKQSQELLQVTDQARDQLSTSLKIVLEDVGKTGSVWKVQ
jgi:cysteinyl-tRNA synthetase